MENQDQIVGNLPQSSQLNPPEPMSGEELVHKVSQIPSLMPQHSKSDSLSLDSVTPKTLIPRTRVPTVATSREDVIRQTTLLNQQKRQIAEANAKRQHAIDTKYNSIDALSDNMKVQRLARPDVNPFQLALHGDSYGGLMVAFNRWKPIANDAHMSKMNDEAMEKVAGNYWDDVLAPLYREGLHMEPMPRDLWVRQAYKEALDFDLKNGYDNSILHDMKNGWNSSLPSLARMGEHIYNIITNATSGVPVSPWYNPKASLSMHNLMDASNPGSWVNRGSRIQQDNHQFWADALPMRGGWFAKASGYTAELAGDALPFAVAAGVMPALGGEELLTSRLASSPIGKKVLGYLLAGGEGLAYGKLTRPKEEQGEAWKDAINFTVLHGMFDIGGFGVSKVGKALEGTAVGDVPIPGIAKGKATLSDVLRAAYGDDSIQMHALRRRQDAAELGMKGQRAATAAEKYTQQKVEHATNIGMVGQAGQRAIYENAFKHLESLEKQGLTKEEIDLLAEKDSKGPNKGYWSPVYSAMNNIRDLLGGKSLAEAVKDPAMIQHIGNSIAKLIVDATAEVPLHVPEVAQQGTAEAVANAGGPTLEHYVQKVREVVQTSGASKMVTEEQIQKMARKKWEKAVEKARQEAVKVVTSDPEGESKRAVKTASDAVNGTKKELVQAKPPAARQLPADLRKAAPRYGLHQLQFEDPMDHAAYIIGGPGESKAHSRFQDFYKEGGGDLSKVGEHRQRLIDGIKKQISSGKLEEGPIKIPKAEAASKGTSAPKAKGVAQKVMITKADEAELRSMGWQQHEIDKMKPAEAQEILKAKRQPLAGVSMRSERTTTSPNDIYVRYTLSPDYNSYLADKAKGAGIPSMNSVRFSNWLAQFYHGLGEDDFANHIQDNFYPQALKKADVWFERQWVKNLGPEHPNFLAFMYNYKDQMPLEMERELEERLVGTKKFQDAFKSGAKTQPLIDFYSHSMYNHVDDFLSSGRWPEEENLFRSSNTRVRAGTKYQKELLQERNTKEIENLRDAFSNNPEAADAAIANVKALQTQRMKAFLQSYDENPNSRKTIQHLNDLITQEITKSGEYERWKF